MSEVSKNQSRQWNYQTILRYEWRYYSRCVSASGTFGYSNGDDVIELIYFKAISYIREKRRRQVRAIYNVRYHETSGSLSLEYSLLASGQSEQRTDHLRHAIGLRQGGEPKTFLLFLSIGTYDQKQLCVQGYIHRTPTNEISSIFSAKQQHSRRDEFAEKSRTPWY